MKYKIITYIIIGVLCATIVLININTYRCKVKLEKISDIETKGNYSGSYWMMITENDKEEIKTYGIDKMDLNLREYNIVISFGREIKEMKYKRKRQFPFNITRFTKTVLKKDLHSKKIFIYRINKSKKVYLDKRGNNIDIKIGKE